MHPHGALYHFSPFAAQVGPVAVERCGTEVYSIFEDIHNTKTIRFDRRLAFSQAVRER